jgi:ribulose bisphosphate carboxylase small subunit
LRTIERLLAEVEGNLARGYAWEEYQIVRTRWEVCGYSEETRSDGTVIRHPRMCLEDYTDTLRRRVPIDPASEKRKRDGLIAKRATEIRQAEANIAACKVAYPE